MRPEHWTGHIKCLDVHSLGTETKQRRWWRVLLLDLDGENRCTEAECCIEAITIQKSEGSSLSWQRQMIPDSDTIL